jgi:hypothetical protein
VGALAVDILIIFKRDSYSGLEFLMRWAHVLAGITWIGLLYYFNFVQVPAFAELDAGARNQAVDKLASRALWWFRWAAGRRQARVTGAVVVPLGGRHDVRVRHPDPARAEAG